jgi:CRP-like cAMP-binding protein
MASNLDQTDVERLGAAVRNWRKVKQGQLLYSTGDLFQNIYALRSGSFKTVVAHQSGREYVSGFFLPGETLGLDGIATESHTCDAIALEDSTVCVIPFHLLEALCREIKSLQQHVHRIMSAEIVRETGQMVLLGNLTAEQRVASFLLNVSDRLGRRGYSPLDFSLRMTRRTLAATWASHWKRSAAPCPASSRKASSASMASRSPCWTGRHLTRAEPDHCLVTIKKTSRGRQPCINMFLLPSTIARARAAP